LKILVTFALETEFAPWRKLRTFRRVGGESHALYEAQIGEAQVKVALTGIGSENARRALRSVLLFAPDIVISSGLAGSLKPVHGLGQILAATAVRDVQGNRQIESDPALLDLAANHGVRRVEMFATVEKIVHTASQKRRLSFEADAIEMESFSVLSEAKAFGIPAVAIRSISDDANEDLPLNFDGIADEQGHIRFGKVIGRLARVPHRLPGVLRLGRQSRRGAENLAKFLDAFAGSLAAHGSVPAAVPEVAAV
jgi:nucleoside phosphorylase